MKALWLENQQLEFRKNFPVPIPGKNEALVRMRMAGICSTDLELVRGYYPFLGIPGHEFVGVVEKSPSDASWIGKRVVGEINIACGECETCLAGLPSHCDHRRTLGIHDWDGVFAEYFLLPLSNLHPVPEDIPDEVAVFTEPLAASNQILEQIHLTPGHKVLIIGAGRLGQLIAQVIHLTGCDLKVVTRHAKQTEILTNLDIHTVRQQELGNTRYDVIVEVSGTPGGFQLARDYIRPRGKIVLKSTYKDESRVNLSEIVVNEVTLIGSRCGPFEPALQLLIDRAIDPRPMVEAVYPLNQGVQAFQHAAMPGVLKVLIQPT